MLHASTSPFYPLFASLDVGAQMMKGRSGVVLWDDTIRLGIELRKKVRAIRREFEQKEKDPARRWFFDAFVPDRLAVPGRDGAPEREIAWEEVATDDLASDPRCWELAPGAGWHGFSHVAPGYAITDPNKLTLLTPGFDRAHRRLFGVRHSCARGRAISAREPRRVREERSQFAAVPAHARRGIEQGGNAAQRAGGVQAAA